MVSSIFNLDMHDNQSHKSLIFQVLANESAMRAKCLYNLLKKQFMVSSSYQATYKLLSELVDKKIILKKNMKYSINPEWLKEEKEKIDKLLSNQSINVEDLYNSNSIKIVNFENLKSLNKYISDVIINLSDYFRGEKLYWKRNYCLGLLINPFNENDSINNLLDKGIEIIGLLTSDNLMNVQAKNYYLNKGIFNIKIKDLENYEFVNVLGDISFIVEFPPDFIEEVRRVCGMNCDEFNISKILEISQRDIKFELKIIKNRNIAQMYKDQIMFGF